MDFTKGDEVCKAPARDKRLKQDKGFSQPTLMSTLRHRCSRDQSLHFTEQTNEPQICIQILQGDGTETGTGISLLTLNSATLWQRR